MNRRIFAAWRCCYGSAVRLMRADAAVEGQGSGADLSPVDSNPSSMHFNVYGGPADVHLLRVSSPSAIRTEMHDVGVDPKTGAVTMKPMTRVFIPSGEKVEFKKGGKHVMVWGVNLIPRRLGEIEVEFLFSNNQRILVEARVQEIDGTDPDEKKALDG